MIRAGKLAPTALAAMLLISGIGGCAKPKPSPTPPAAEIAPPPAPAESVAPPPAPAAPPPAVAAPPSIGPRPETAKAPPPVARRPTPRPQIAQAPPTAPPVPPGQRGRFVVLNFDSADIETVVHAASEIVGFNYVIAPDVRGKVTVQTSGRIPQEDVFGVLLAILEVHGFTAVRAGNLYKVIRIEGARERAVPTIIGGEADPGRVTDEIVTQIVPVRYSSVTDLGTLLRPLISSRGTLVAHRETNILIITDAASNMRRLLDIIRLVDIEVALDELQIIPVRYADAGDLAAVLTQLFVSGRLRRTVTTAPGAPPAPPTPAAPRQPAATAGAEGAGPDRPPLIIAERRSNSLIVYSRKTDLETIQRLIGQLDVNIYGGRRVFIYYAESAKAKELAATLNAIYAGREGAGATAPGVTPAAAGRRAGEPTPPAPLPAALSGPPGGGASTGELGVIEGQVRFIGDETTNSVIVTTFPRNWEEIETTIKQLDRSPRQVLIEVLVAEITLTDDLRLGIDWAIKMGSLRLAQSTISPPTITAPSRELPIPGLPLALPGGGLTAFALDTDKFFAMLNTLASENKVNVISSPHVMTSENKKAIINVSDSIPIVTSQQVPIGAGAVSATTPTTAVVGTQTVEYRDAGVILTVTPRIGERGTVALDVKQEVNDIGAAEPPTGSRRIIKREAETAVVLMNQQTLVLGGLIRDRLSWEDRGIPFLKDVPVLGYLFGAKIRTVNKTELIILITPRVIGTALDAARITEEMRRVTPSIEEATRKAPRSPAMLPLKPPPPPPPVQSPGPSSP
ncbi:MAG TPA: type II secretion system secretin GspD [Methylomirabilota bacterium]|nr:type II secretion system secretin GspD [Methylomirabilota bacterium]